MALSIDTSPLFRFLDTLTAEATPAIWLWQAAVAVAAVGLAWCFAHFLLRRVQPSLRWKFGEGEFARVAFPVFAYLLLILGRAILVRHQPVALLDILAAILVAAIGLRLAVYILGHVLPRGEALRKLLRSLAWIAWIAVILHVTGLLPEVIRTLDAIGFTSGKSQQRYSLWLLIQGAAALAFTLAIALYIARVTEGRVMAEQAVDMSTRVVISKLLRIAAVFIAVLVALPLVGIDITALSIFGGALGVGLGFGLQKIAANYVSGFIVLLDRSLRLGDTIQIGDRKGEVKEIASRYTVIKGSDGIESIVPNEKLITEMVNHHTYSDPRVAVTLNVAVAYDADVDRACQLLEQVARGEPRVMPDPPPAGRVKSLGDFGVHLELSAWMGDLAQGESDLKSVLYRKILRTFRAEGIKVAYRRREMLRETPPSATAETNESDV
jgi:small-conductance mechanosensitive channel